MKYMAGRGGAIRGKTVPLSQALEEIDSGMTLMYGGFGGVGTPPTLVDGILEKGVSDLHLVGNDAGFPDIGVGPLIVNRRVRSPASYTHLRAHETVLDLVC